MDAERLRKRIIAFYVAGFVNLVLGLYVLLQGRTFLEHRTWLILLFIFFGFAAVDFWFPRLMKEKWLEEQQRAAELQRQAAEQQKKRK